MTRNTNTSPLLIYVNPLGGDYNPGLRPTQAVRTIGQALAIALQYDLTNNPCSIFLTAGTYTDDVVLQESIGGLGITIKGVGPTTVLNCQISGVDLVSTVTLSDVTLLQTSITKSVLTLSNASVTLSNCTLSLQPTALSSIFPLIALNGAAITLSGALNIIYDGAFLLPGWCYTGGGGSTISGINLALTSNTGINRWTSAGVYVASGGVANFSGSTQVADTCRGSQWFVESGGTLYIVPSLLALPGDSLGGGSGTIAPQGTVIGGGVTFNSFKVSAISIISNVVSTFSQNQIPNSESLENAAFWTKNAVTSNLVSLDPQQYDLRGVGYPWMDKFLETATTGIHSISRIIPVLGGQAVTLSIVGKRDPGLSRDRVFIRYSTLNGAIYVVAIYNIATNTVTFTQAVGTGAVYTSSSITSDTSIGTCVLTCQLPDTGSSTIVEFGIADTDTTYSSYLGSVSNGIYLADASLVLGGTYLGYQYLDTDSATITFGTNSPGSLITSPTGGTLVVPTGTLTAYLAGFAAETTAFTISETANRATVITSANHVVISGGSLSDLTITPVSSLISAGGVSTITIASSTATPASTKTITGYTGISYLDLDGAVQSITKNWSVTPQVTPTISDVRAVFVVSISNGGTFSQNWGAGSGYQVQLYCPGCSATNVLTVSGVSITGTSSSSYTLTKATIEGGTTLASTCAKILVTWGTSGVGQTTVLVISFLEIAGTFTLTMSDTV